MANLCMIAYTYYARDPRVRREAEALVEVGHSVSFITLREKGEHSREIVNGVQLIRLPLGRWRGSSAGYLLSYFLFFILASIYLTTLHPRRRFDLIHINNMPNFLVFCGIIPKLFGARLILDIHDPMPELFSSIFPGRLNNFFQRLLRLEERVSERFVDQVITVSDGMRQLLSSRGIRAERIEIIMNLPDPSIFGRVQRAPSHPGTFTLIYAGTISRRHNLDIAILALDSLRDEMPDLNLKIVGDGPEVPHLKQLAADKHLTDRILFEDSVPLDKVPGLLAGADAAIASYAEDLFGAIVFPTKAVEALMVGIPVICARTETVLHYLDETIMFYYEPGVPVSFAEQIRLMRSNPDLTAQKQESASRFLLTSNWIVEKKRFTAIIGRLLAGDTQDIHD
jgi:glycosyltransferase involved in cell wall biosynthesis